MLYLGHGFISHNDLTCKDKTGTHGRPDTQSYCYLALKRCFLRVAFPPGRTVVLRMRCFIVREPARWHFDSQSHGLSETAGQ